MRRVLRVNHSIDSPRRQAKIDLLLALKDEQEVTIGVKTTGVFCRLARRSGIILAVTPAAQDKGITTALRGGSVTDRRHIHVAAKIECKNTRVQDMRLTIRKFALL